MGTPAEFDLERAVATWRRFLASARGLLDDDLDELEVHLRDEFEALCADGVPPREAYRRARHRMGDYATIEASYQDVYWTKLRQEQRLGHVLFLYAAMLKNYVKIALRNLRKEQGYAFINIIGLSIGIACFVLILLYVRYEFSYDRHHEAADRIYRVVKDNPGSLYRGSTHFAVTPAPLAPALRTIFPEVESATMFDTWQTRVGRQDLHLYQQVVFADSQFFDVFSPHTVQGDVRRAFREPGLVILTRSLAQKLFGGENPVGALVHASGGKEEDLTVAAVIEDPPRASHFTFDLVRRMYDDDRYEKAQTEWGNSSYRTYLLLKPGQRADGIGEKLTRHAHEQHELTRASYELDDQYYLQRLTDIHLRSHINFELSSNNDIRYVYLLFSIGVVILLIACTNYVNLATARAARREKEIGVRKAVGAHRNQLVNQFMLESMLLTLIAFLSALGLAYVLLPAFSGFVAQELSWAQLGDPALVLALAGIFLVVALMAGGYPSLVLASTRAVTVLKKSTGTQLRGGGLRRLLVIGQFCAATILLISGLVIYRQLYFLGNTQLGFNKEQVVTMQIRDQRARDNLETIRQELLTNPQVVGVSAGQYLPFNVGSRGGYDEWEGNDGEAEIDVYRSVIDTSFLDVMEIELIAGRNVREEEAESESAFLFNETAVRQLGWTPEEAVGKQFYCAECRIVGVVEDYYFQPLHQPMAPLMLYPSKNNRYYAFIRIQPTAVRETLAAIEQTMKRFAPEEPFEYSFMDERYAAMYSAEQRFGKTIGIFTVLAIFVACLGLFGLASFTAQRRTKEVGIRKVLGASSSDIVILLSKEFAVLVLVAFAVATPVGYVVMSRWLEDFAYRMALGPGTFLMAGGGVLLLALLTVSYQAHRAAKSDPAQTLRYE